MGWKRPRNPKCLKHISWLALCVFLSPAKNSPKKRLRANLNFEKFCSYLFGIKCHKKRILASLKRFVKANVGSKSADILNVKVRIGRKEFLININLCNWKFPLFKLISITFYTYSKSKFSLHSRLSIASGWCLFTGVAISFHSIPFFVLPFQK